ncbi:GreA/GreB family elongation factor [Pelomonas sp. CA6]|uniref:GreA/GreB family elongation factor n=1 Tax=Pelomonas sp. CA6 TaxID=2907999 RepID=UPI001F4C3CD2|nr:GreA/GreB family elongation factor [Pelomonas sp. CA6]MCH7343881.1 GreA/GreB family elongation factor [Pelomonas sp. CA6]
MHHRKDPVPPQERVLSTLDFARLKKLGQGRMPAALRELLDDYDLYEPQEMPADVVTMHSRVVLAHEDSGQRQQLTLCYPDQTAPAAGQVSVLSPLGAGLLGRRVGELACWTLPGGEQREARIAELAFQPEAQGLYTL